MAAALALFDARGRRPVIYLALVAGALATACLVYLAATVISDIRRMW